VFDAPVLFEIEDRMSEIVAELEVKCRADHLVVLASGTGGYLASRRDDHRATN